MSSSSADTGEKIQIVIADDHPIVREGLTAILGLQKDFQIVGQAEDGEQACQLCHQFSPDILILDLRMPRKDGLEVVIDDRNRIGQRLGGRFAIQDVALKARWHCDVHLP